MKANTIFIVILSLVILSCSDKAKKETVTIVAAPEPAKVEKPLSYFIEKRFESNPLTETNVSFNDGSTFDLSKPLNHTSIAPNSHTFFLGDYLDKNHLKDVDSNGVVLQNGTYNITEIARVALFAINSYKKEGGKNAKKVFLDQMGYIENNFYEREFYGFWYFPFESPLYYLEPAWPSALSQGWLMNACMEAYHLTKEEKWARILEKALKAYMVPVENGGFKRMWEANEVWYEEYSTARPSRVLNGGIFGLESVYNVYRDTGWDLAKKIFDSGVATVKNHLQDYDAVWTSRYNLADWKNEVAFEHYHEIHIMQMLWLHQVTGDSIFKHYAQKFLENDRQGFNASSRYALPDKMKSINASYTIDPENHGTDALMDEIWAFGSFWSSHQAADLVIDFGQFRSNIKGLTLYHVNDKSKDVPFTIYVRKDEHSEWQLVQNFEPKYVKDKISIFNQTGNFETYVEHFKIVEPANGTQVKIAFDATAENIIALRNLNFIFDRTADIEQLQKAVKEHYKAINLIN